MSHAPSRSIHRFAKRVRNRIFTMWVSGGFKHFGKGSVIGGAIDLEGEAMTEVGSRVYFGPGCWLMALGGPRADGRAVIRIGDRCSFAGGVVITAFESVEIGDDVITGRNIHISDHAHEFSDVSKPIRDQGVTPPRPVCIGTGSWIGQGAVICPGVSIGKNCVIGANSVVRADVPDHCVAAGVPARIIRQIGVNEARPPAGT
jgi:acetyltransferase-like isoleucine patch superfamily enzyme